MTFKFEGVTSNVLVSQSAITASEPIYRLYSGRATDHFYTVLRLAVMGILSKGCLDGYIRSRVRCAGVYRFLGCTMRRGQIIFIRRARRNMRVLWREVLRTKVLWGMSCLLDISVVICGVSQLYSLEGLDHILTCHTCLNPSCRLLSVQTFPRQTSMSRPYYVFGRMDACFNSNFFISSLCRVVAPLSLISARVRTARSFVVIESEHLRV